MLGKVLKSTKDIKNAARICKVSERTAYRCKKSLKVMRAIHRKKGSGRRSVLVKSQKQKIQAPVRRTLSSHVPIKNEQEIQASAETIRRYLLDAGFTRRRPTHKLDLLPRHVERRFEWVSEHRNFIYSPEIILTDECSIWLIWLFDNNREGWFNNQEDHPLYIDKHCGKYTGEQQ